MEDVSILIAQQVHKFVNIKHMKSSGLSFASLMTFDWQVWQLLGKFEVES